MDIIRLLKSKLPIVLVVLTAATWVITLIILAKYNGKADVNGTASLQGFDVSLDVVSPDTAANPNVIDENGVVVLTPEQYREFQLNVKKTGEGWAYIRVSIEESWRTIDSDNEEMVIVTEGGSLTHNTGKTVILLDDEHFYVKGIVKSPDTISIIDGANILPDEIRTGTDNYTVRLSIKVEAIQYNRIAEFWDVNTSDLS